MRIQGKTTSLNNRTNFHQLIEHVETDLFVLRNKNGLSAEITNYGARWVSMNIPVKGKAVNVVAGFSSLEEYLNSTEPYYGALIGRYANRISQGKFKVNDVEYSLNLNDGANHLHGGKKGFHNVVWEVVAAADHSITLEYLSVNGEENYPGELHVRITYSLTDNNEMEILVQATTDEETVVNITHHAFFNLNGFDSNILDHQLMINAAYFTPVNDTLIPTGELTPVDDTPFDFRNLKKIGEQIFSDDEQLIFGKGYDHNFVLLKSEPFSHAATALGNLYPIRMEVYTTEPGLQLYSGNVMKGENVLSGNIKDERFYAFCLETQHFPDSPNQPSFPSVVLKPGDEFQTRTVFKFFTIPE